MIALINLFIDPDLDYGWMQCSKLAAKGSVNHAHNLRKWVVAYMQHGVLARTGPDLGSARMDTLVSLII